MFYGKFEDENKTLQKVVLIPARIKMPNAI